MVEVITAIRGIGVGDGVRDTKLGIKKEVVGGQ